MRHLSNVPLGGMGVVFWLCPAECLFQITSCYFTMVNMLFPTSPCNGNTIQRMLKQEFYVILH